MRTKQNVSESIHICLISDQPIANLLPLLLERPRQVIFLVSPEMKAQAERLKKLVQPRGIMVTIKKIPSAYDFKAIINVCEEIEKEAEATNADLVLNVTGGTKIAALATFQSFYFNNRRIIYLDTTHNQLLQLAPEITSFPVQENLIKVHDYLVAYGMNPHVNPAAIANRRPQLQNLVRLLIDNEDLLSRLNAAIGRQGKKPQYINISLNELGEGAEKLGEILEGCSVATKTGSAGLNIPSHDKIFFCQGGWLEEYVYWMVKELSLNGLDLAMNVSVEWDGQGKRPTENEFDVLFTHSNRLHLISCKASNPERETATGSRATEALNELDTLADRAGGLFGRAILVSARRLSDFDRERAKKMKIKLVDGREVLRLKEHLQTWLYPGKTT
ncbi:MAG: DUF1887 family protein [Desulfoarculaceae bacterium]|nr:DUF1887 family protein [Desulfoarculaceae bacterium]